MTDQGGNDSQPKVTLTRTNDDWNVLIDGDYIGHVYRERQQSSRYPHGSPSVARRGRWRWMASRINDEDFATRREAVAELVRRSLVRSARSEGVS